MEGREIQAKEPIERYLSTHAHSLSYIRDPCYNFAQYADRPRVTMGFHQQHGCITFTVLSPEPL